MIVYNIQDIKDLTKIFKNYNNERKKWKLY